MSAVAGDTPRRLRRLSGFLGLIGLVWLALKLFATLAPMQPTAGSLDLDITVEGLPNEPASRVSQTAPSVLPAEAAEKLPEADRNERALSPEPPAVLRAAGSQQETPDIDKIQADQPAAQPTPAAATRVESPQDQSPETDSSQPLGETKVSEMLAVSAPAVAEQAAPVSPSPVPTQPARAPDAATPDSAITTLVDEALFRAVRTARDKEDRRDETQRSAQAQGAYGWGIQEQRVDPDRGARELGGVLFALRDGDVYRLDAKGNAQPVSAVTRAYGAIGLAASGADAVARLNRALRNGDLRGSSGDYRLWFLFQSADAINLQNQVVATFECQRSHAAETDEDFIRQARLRGGVLVVRRPAGGRLGVFDPRYFERADERVPVAPDCRYLHAQQRLLREHGAASEGE